jgi:hypothetical protein
MRKPPGAVTAGPTRYAINAGIIESSVQLTIVFGRPLKKQQT